MYHFILNLIKTIIINNNQSKQSFTDLVNDLWCFIDIEAQIKKIVNKFFNSLLIILKEILNIILDLSTSPAMALLKTKLTNIINNQTNFIEIAL